jgi:dihydrodipicolinate synthase/N-acetylneuraminate lyase
MISQANDTPVVLFQNVNIIEDVLSVETYKLFKKSNNCVIFKQTIWLSPFEFEQFYSILETQVCRPEEGRLRECIKLI